MKTITHFFENSVNKYGDNIYIWEKKKDKYKGTTYKEIRDLVHQFAAGLISMGVKKGERLTLLSEGRNEWVISELGILFSGAVNVPLSIKLGEPADIKFRFEHSGSKILIVSGNQSKKVKTIKNEIKGLEKIIYLDPLETYEKDELFFGDVLQMGVEYLKTKNDEFEKIWKSVLPEDYANISYTSGTTADPKGIILSHLNYVANVEQAYTLMEIPETYKTLLILPWDHSFAHTVGIYILMGKGASIASIQVGSTPMETLKNIPGNIKEIQPTIMLSAPALAKNFRKNIEKGIRQKGPFIEKLFNKALKLAYSYNRLGWDKGQNFNKLKLPLLKLYDKLIFTKIRENFGGKLEFFVGGAALLDIELQKFFYAIGIPMFQGYGLSEAAPVISGNSMKKHKLGSSGFLVKNLELKICSEEGKELPLGEKGEIVVKGKNVMVGYWQNEKATKEAIKNGWLHTGDLGYTDNDGFLYVLGRYKSLLISDDGEKYSPEGIEEAFIEQSKYIDQCMLYNNQNKYTIALIVPNREAVKRWMTENSINNKSDEGKKDILKLFESELNEYQKNGKYETMFPHRWLPAAIAILEEGFTEENQLLNSTLKIVRRKITECYREKIDFLYSSEAKDINNSVNMDVIGKLF